MDNRLHDVLDNVLSDKWTFSGHELLRASRRDELAGDDLFNVFVVYDRAFRSLNALYLKSPGLGFREQLLHGDNCSGDW